tara:strand:- start:590 stop:1165 length:576 start_codon:yes stop_codon:yes gene_type:complete
MDKIGIQPPHLAFYSECIRFHCDAAMGSIDYLASFIEMTNETQGHYEMTRDITNHVLDSLQSILIHAAALSRYFWPPQKGENNLHKYRGQELKEYFGLNDESPLKTRTLRNQLEHFDENLDKYLSDRPIVGYIIPSYVGGTPRSDGVPTHIFRAFYIDRGIFEVLGVEHEVQPIVDELCRIHARFHRANNT